MIVVNEPWAAWLAVVTWGSVAGMLLLARKRGALRGTGWLALACGIFGGIQAIEAFDLISGSASLYLVSMVGMGWAAGSAAFCYGLWRWSLQGEGARGRGH